MLQGRTKKTTKIERTKIQCDKTEEAGARITKMVLFQIGVGVPIYHRPSRPSYTYDNYGNFSYPGKPSGAFAAQYQARNFAGFNSIPRGFDGDIKQELKGPAPVMGGPMFTPKDLKDGLEVEN